MRLGIMRKTLQVCLFLCLLLNLLWFPQPNTVRAGDSTQIFNLGLIIEDLNTTERQWCMDWISQFDPFVKWNFILWQPYGNLNDEVFVNFLRVRGLLMGSEGYVQAKTPIQREKEVDAMVNTFKTLNITLKGLFMFQPDTYTMNYAYSRYNFEYCVGYCFEQYLVDFMTMKGGWQLPYYHNPEHALKPAEANEGLVVFPHVIWDWASSLTYSHHLNTHILNPYPDIYPSSSQAVNYCLKLVNESLSCSEPFGYASAMFEWSWIINHQDFNGTTKDYYQRIINQKGSICQLYNETASWFRASYPKTPTYRVAFTSPYDGQQIEWYLNPDFRIARVGSYVKSYVIFGSQTDIWLNNVCYVDFNMPWSQSNCIDNSLKFDIDDLGGGILRDSPKGGSVYYTGNLADFPTFYKRAISSIRNTVIEDRENDAYFIFADPQRMTRAVAAYDVASGNILYGMCQNLQNQGFDTNELWVSQEEENQGKLLLSDKTVLMFGSRFPHLCVKYLEERRLVPVAFNITIENGQQHLEFVDTATDRVIVDAPRNSIDFQHEDYFVVMTLKDENNNHVFILYGFDWKGTWGAGIYLKAVYPNIDAYSAQYYVFHWSDINNDGVPQPNEMTQIP